MNEPLSEIEFTKAMIRMGIKCSRGDGVPLSTDDIDQMSYDERKNLIFHDIALIDENSMRAKLRRVAPRWVLKIFGMGGLGWL